MTARARGLVGVGLLLALGVFCALRWQVAQDITHFLPTDADLRVAHISRAVADSSLARTMILTVEAPDEARAAAAAAELGRRLREHPGIAWVRGGLDDDLQRAFHALYFPRRLDFLADTPEQTLPARLSPAGLSQAARELKAQLARPSGALFARMGGADPLLAFHGLLERLRAAQGEALRMVDGQLVTPDGRHGVVFLATRASPFDGAAQAPVLAAIDAEFEAVAAAHDDGLRLERSGVNRHAQAAEAAIRADISRVSALSTVGVLLAFLLALRSLWSVGLSLVPIVAGLLAATAVCLLLFERVHGLTLAFGASLIGVCVDYPVHYLCHQAFDPAPDGPDGTVRRLWRSLWLGALTTIAGMAGLGFAGFPGVREIAVFSSVGVLAALLTTRYLLPAWTPRRSAPTALALRTGAALERAVDGLRRRRWAQAALPALALGLCAVGLPRLRWSDDLKALAEARPALTAEDERLRARVSSVDPGRFVVALAEDDEGALRRSEAVQEVLSTARGDGLLDAFRSVHGLVWSAERQRRNRAALDAVPDLATRLEAAFAAEGFRPEALSAFRAHLQAPRPEPLTLAAVEASPFGPMVAPFRLRVGDQVGLVTFLTGVRDADALASRLASLDSVVYFDQQAFLDSTYRHHRDRIVSMLVVGAVAVLGLLVAVWRDVRRSLAAFAPAALAAPATLAIVALTGVEANLLHALGLLLVLSMGVDYGIYMVEAPVAGPATAATLLGLVLACVSTVLSFGLLGLSDNPALRALGVTSGVGVSLSLVLAPAARLLFRPRHEAGA